MKRISFLIVVFAITLTSNSQVYDDLSRLKSQVERLSAEVVSLKTQEKKNANSITALSKTIDDQQVLIDSLRSISTSNQEKIEATANILGKDIDSTRLSITENVSTLESSINAKSLLSGIIGVIALILATAFFLHQRNKYSKNINAINSFDERINKIKEEQKTLEDEMASSSSKLLDAIEKQISIMSSKKETKQPAEPDHSLAIAVANEIARIQQNLNHMDENVRGVSQLKNRAKAIITTLNSKQYEIPELLGKSYHEGDNMIATMEFNEELDEGTNRIKRVIKPQVSYAGKVIQQAEVVVEYNE